VKAISVLDDPLFVAVAPAHPCAGRASVTAATLRHERWIVGSTEPGSTLLGPWAGSAWEPDVAFVARDWVAKLGLVAAGLGVTVVPGLAVPALPSTVAVVRVDHPAAVRTVAVVYRPRTSNDRRRHDFTEALRDTAAQLSAEVRHRLRRNG
jgi:DNA-binding transcriptional LysR family regulator